MGAIEHISKSTNISIVDLNEYINDTQRAFKLHETIIYDAFRKFIERGELDEKTDNYMDVLLETIGNALH